MENMLLAIVFFVSNLHLNVAKFEWRNRTIWTSSMHPDIFFQNYRDWNEYKTFIDYLLVTYPSIASKDILGQTVEGRQIPIITLSTSEDDSSEEAKPGLYIQAGIHAVEWLANSATMYILNGLCEKYDQDVDITKILNAINIYIVPTVNIDGYIHSWWVDRTWRKNRRDNGNGSFGVDINRNFDGPQGTWCIPGGASTDPLSNKYCGPYPFSEPEAQAIRNFIFDMQGNIRHNIVATVDMHVRGPNILYPWAWSINHISEPYYTEYVTLSQDISDAIFEVHGVRYEPTDDYNGGFSAGTMRDYPFAISNGDIFSFTWEGRKTSSVSDTTHIIPGGQEQLAGMVMLAKLIMDYQDHMSSESLSGSSDSGDTAILLNKNMETDDMNLHNDKYDSISIHFYYNTLCTLWIMLIIFFVVNCALISYFYFCGDKKRVNSLN